MGSTKFKNMDSAPGTVSQWIANAKVGDEKALANLHARYWPELVKTARKKMDATRIPDRDAEDIAQDAFIVMFRTLQAGKTPRLRNRHQWLAFLTHIIACRTINEFRRSTTARRGGKRRIPVDIGSLDAMDATSRPVEKAILHDCYRYYMDSLPENLRSFAELHLAGFNNEEIAERLSCVTRTVERKLKLLKMYWQEIADLELSDD